MLPSMRTLRYGLALALSVWGLAGCPRAPSAPRDGGTPCGTTEECNPPGRTCGEISLCVNNFCSVDRVVRVCVDGGYADSGQMTGNCASYEDCNAPPRCGLVVSCVNFQCDINGPRIEIPCADAGTADAGTADARSPDAGAGEAGASDARAGD